MYTPTHVPRPSMPQQEMGGFWGNLWDELKEFGQAGLQAKYGQQPGQQQAPTQPVVVQPSGFFDVYGKYIVVGGLALGAMLLLRKKKR